ncbi:MAG TPA: T9SS type A sorting domain-containing protein, partial [Bacteroidia bacterium]|nr:T9SS type A sorting domain-containing protein [Bacteroidia bacterium]
SHAELVSASQAIVEVYNILGEKVTVATLKQVQGDNLIDLTDQPNGIYLYRVIKEDGSLVGSGKLIIQK